ncbi:DUF1835 domain-containing protein [Sporosarcina limicola]|nr:DUF1835 domain-containing protein [Sporosarcina limicola]
MDGLKDSIESLQEDEAKTLLYHLLLRINMLEETEDTKDLHKTYKDFLNFSANKNMPEKDYGTVHIVFGDSASGSLKMALRDMGLQDKEKVICLSGLFSIGPLWKLHEEIGLNHRYEWLENHLISDNENMEKDKILLRDAFSEIELIPNQIPIIIWTGNNSHEQAGVRIVSYLLKEKLNDIHLINSSIASKALLSRPNYEYCSFHTAEIPHEGLKLIYEKNSLIHPLSPEVLNKFEKEWEELATKQEVLRLWKNGEIFNVDVDFYDDYIIDAARKLHGRNENRNFMKSARVIGEVIGHLDQYIGDTFLEYRVRHLIMNGIFEMKGVPKAMRFYSVKLRDAY